MKLIHCADLHLDSPMESNLPTDKARERRSEILSTFSDLVELADRNGADGILIAGDLFDSSRTTKKTERYVLDLIRRHPALSFFYLAGNHDSGARLGSAENRPDNLFTFGEGWTSYYIGDVTVAGSEKPDPTLLDLPADRVNILLLHGQTRDGRAADKDAIPFRKYRDHHVDYMALGHLHAYREAELDERGIACYSGCLEGRGFDECGQKGYVLLEIENRTVRHTFVPFSRRSLHEVSCDISDCLSQSDVEECAIRSVEGIPAKDLVKLVLVGSTSPELLPDPKRLEQLLSERFYFAKLNDRTGIRIRPEDYSHAVSLKGEFVRRVMDSGLSQREKERILACGFRALGGEELDL